RRAGQNRIPVRGVCSHSLVPKDTFIDMSRTRRCGTSRREEKEGLTHLVRPSFSFFMSAPQSGDFAVRERLADQLSHALLDVLLVIAAQEVDAVTARVAAVP